MIPLSRRSFDVLVGMDRLSKRKFVIVCHEKVVEVPLEGSRKLRVQGECTLGAAKALMNAKVDEPKVGDISVMRDFVDVFPEDLSGLPPQRQLNVKDKILATLSETSKVENAPVEMLRDLDQQMEKREDDAQSEAFKQENALAERLHSLHQQMEWKEDKSLSLVLWVEIRESSLTGPELVLDTTDKVVLIKEKLQATRDRQKSYADKRRKPLEFEVGDIVLLKVSPGKGVIRFGKKGKLASRYVGPFEILERVGLVAYRLRLPEELSGAKLLAVRYRVKVCWNSKRGPEFTWEREDFMKSKYPQLFVDRADESTNLISGRDFLKEGIL
ncbi:hypothetical protein Tco_0978097 [Tanacetum coccineum]|uniref:Tf2-1-like SH3-like domain-containing protein n=1 Tax=Tanacetum coccineum TaxID=301880 RepID=A0ABQ5EM06_9ASTR